VPFARSPPNASQNTRFASLHPPALPAVTEPARRIWEKRSSLFPVSLNSFRLTLLIRVLTFRARDARALLGDVADYAVLHKEDVMTTKRCIATLLISLIIAATASTSWADPEPARAGANAAAAVSDVFYVPGKAIVCGVSGVLWIGAMALTLGTLYQESNDFVKGACGGKWVLTGEDMKETKHY